AAPAFRLQVRDRRLVGRHREHVLAAGTGHLHESRPSCARILALVPAAPGPNSRPCDPDYLPPGVPPADTIGRRARVSRTHLRTCPLCEGMCGLAIEVDGDRIVSIRGDPEDVFSHGHVCPKAVALKDVHEDPDRLRHPLRRRGRDWEEVGWDEALDEAARRLVEVQRAHGPHAVAVYQGNPTVHNYGAILFGRMLVRTLGTRSRYSATSVDQLPHMLASLLMFGPQLLLPVPDVDRTSFLLVLGANPLVSNGSLMTAAGIERRLRALRGRGGRLVVVDPRRTETAALADTHLAIRPGTDALLLLALLEVVFAEGRAPPGRL